MQRSRYSAVIPGLSGLSNHERERSLLLFIMRLLVIFGYYSSGSPAALAIIARTRFEFLDEAGRADG